MQVSIAIGGRFHAFDLAWQLQTRGYLRSLITSYPKFKVKEWGIEPRKIRTVLSHELLNRIWWRYAKPRFHFERDWGVAINDRFDRLAARRIPPGSDIFVGWSGMSLHCHRRAKELGALRVCERNSTHIGFQKKILEEEYSRFGVKAQVPNQEVIDRELAEYEEADYICVPGSFAYRTFLEEGVPESKMVAVPFGVDPKNFNPAPKNDSVFRVIHCGALTLRKGVHYLLQAFHELKLPNSELWMIGPVAGDIKPFLEKYAAPNVIARGTFDQAQLYKEYAQGSVFCLASIEEGFALVISQAMCCGLPVVCTENTTGHDIVRDGVDGYVVPIRSVEALKERLLLLYRNEEMRKEMGRSAREYVLNNFTWDHYGEKMMKFYSRITAPASKLAPARRG